MQCSAMTKISIDVTDNSVPLIWWRFTVSNLSSVAVPPPVELFTSALVTFCLISASTALGTVGSRWPLDIKVTASWHLPSPSFLVRSRGGRWRWWPTLANSLPCCLSYSYKRFPLFHSWAEQVSKILRRTWWCWKTSKAINRSFKRRAFRMWTWWIWSTQSLHLPYLPTGWAASSLQLKTLPRRKLKGKMLLLLYRCQIFTLLRGGQWPLDIGTGTGEESDHCRNKFSHIYEKLVVLICCRSDWNCYRYLSAGHAGLVTWNGVWCDLILFNGLYDVTP